MSELKSSCISDEVEEDAAVVVEEVMLLDDEEVLPLDEEEEELSSPDDEVELAVLLVPVEVLDVSVDDVVKDDDVDDEVNPSDVVDETSVDDDEEVGLEVIVVVLEETVLEDEGLLPPVVVDEISVDDDDDVGLLVIVVLLDELDEELEDSAGAEEVDDVDPLSVDDEVMVVDEELELKELLDDGLSRFTLLLGPTGKKCRLMNMVHYREKFLGNGNYLERTPHGQRNFPFFYVMNNFLSSETIIIQFSVQFFPCLNIHSNNEEEASNLSNRK